MLVILVAVKCLEQVANVDDILGEQFLSDATPSEQEIMVSGLYRILCLMDSYRPY